MSTGTDSDVREPDESLTTLLQAWHGGDRAAFDTLLPQVYDELRRQAARLMAGERRALTLQTTALVHEAVLRLMGWDGVAWHNRQQFLGVSVQIMRRVLVDLARRRHSAKRGRSPEHVQVDEQLPAAEGLRLDLLALDRALDGLAELDARKARVVECRFFAGLSVEETARALEVSPRTVQNEWTFARAWLHRALVGEQPHVQ
jgi:RNA polymerase sigma factor (TIGR02999 family)